MEENFNFGSGNGKEEGEPGRPSNSFKEAKIAKEAIEAISKLEGGPEIIGALLGKLKGGSKNGSGENLKRNLKDLVVDPFSTGLFAQFGKYAAIPAAIAALWTAEEFIKLPHKVVTDTDVDDLNRPIFRDPTQEELLRLDNPQPVLIGYEKKKEIITEYLPFPPLLHTFYNLLMSTIMLIQGYDEFKDKVADILSTSIKAGAGDKDEQLNVIQKIGFTLRKWAGGL